MKLVHSAVLVGILFFDQRRDITKYKLGGTRSFVQRHRKLLYVLAIGSVGVEALTAAFMIWGIYEQAVTLASAYYTLGQLVVGVVYLRATLQYTAQDVLLREYGVERGRAAR